MGKFSWEIIAEKDALIAELESKVKQLQALKAKADDLAAAACDREKNLTQAVVKYLEASKELDNG